LRAIRKKLKVNITKVELYLEIQFVPCSKHSLSVIKTIKLMVYSEIIAVCSEIYIEHTNTLCGQNVELRKVQRDGKCISQRTTEA
jgi:hypothetical protein